MSHYVVAVIHRADQNIEDLLAPYDEDLKVAPYLEYTKEEAIEYGKKNYTPGHTDEELWKMVADGYETDDQGNIYSNYNPASKWDWYQVGGRWNNELPTIHGPANEARIADIDKSKDFTSYAVITPNGIWYAPGDMGWFGYSSETEDEAKKWHDEWQKRWIDNQDPELIMTIVDCHI